MNILGIDISTIPWPMFMLLVFMIVAFIWYLNVHIPTVDQLEDIKSQNKKLLEETDRQVRKTTEMVLEIKQDISTQKVEENNIVRILTDMKAYTARLSEIITRFDEKDHVTEEQIITLKEKIEILSDATKEIKEQLLKKKYF